MDTIQCKEKFLEENRDFTEIKPTVKSISIGESSDIEEDEVEIWLMQCPKHTDMSLSQGQKLKLPGRSHIQDLETVSVETVDVLTLPFSFCNSKGKYEVRLLPIQGNIVLRNRLKASETVTEQDIQAVSPDLGRVPFPHSIKVRHPLLGANFQQNLNIETAVSERIKNADKQSAHILREALFRSVNKVTKAKKLKSNSEIEAIIIETDQEDYSTSRSHKKKSKKRKNSDSSATSKKIKKGYIKDF